MIRNDDAAALARWMRRQERLNPAGIDLGLERLAPVAEVLGLAPPGAPLVSVAGTNGKGSTVAFIEALGRAAGLRVASYGSPFLLRYGECVRVGGIASDDAGLLRAFEAVEAARGDVPLTAFEFRTLAAIHQLKAADPDLLVLEVGLGGRLDAVNILDADVAVVCSIGLDHQEWLGDDLHGIAREKAGIARAGRPLVCADPDAAALVAPVASELRAQMVAPGAGLDVRVCASGWAMSGPAGDFEALPWPALAGMHQIANAAGAITAFALATGRRPLSRAVVAEALEGVRIPGRLQRLPGPPVRVVDVAHNPQAAGALARWLAQTRGETRWRAVCGVYRDKDASGIFRALAPEVAAWHLAPLSAPRGRSTESLERALVAVDPEAAVQRHVDVADAWRAAVAALGAGQGLVGVGSFETVRRILESSLETGFDG